MAAGHCAKEALWLRNLLSSLGIPSTDLTTLYCDNQGAVTLTKDASYHSHSKHINIAHHFIHEWVEMKEISFKYLLSHSMPADALTKLLATPKQVKFCKYMGSIQEPSPSHEIEGEY